MEDSKKNNELETAKLNESNNATSSNSNLFAIEANSKVNSAPSKERMNDKKKECKCNYRCLIKNCYVVVVDNFVNVTIPEG